MNSKKQAPGKNGAKLDIEGVVARDRIRPLQFVHGAFLLSIVGMTVLTTLARPATSQPRGEGLVQLLALVGMGLWIAGYGIGMWWFMRRMKRDVLLKVIREPFRGPAFLAATATDADKIAHHLQRAWAMRMSAWSIGPVVSLLAVQAAIQGNLASHDSSIAVSGVLPMVVFFIVSIVIFPTPKRIRALLLKSMES